MDSTVQSRMRASVLVSVAQTQLDFYVWVYETQIKLILALISLIPIRCHNSLSPPGVEHMNPSMPPFPYMPANFLTCLCPLCRQPSLEPHLFFRHPCVPRPGFQGTPLFLRLTAHEPARYSSWAAKPCFHHACPCSKTCNSSSLPTGQNPNSSTYTNGSTRKQNKTTNNTPAHPFSKYLLNECLSWEVQRPCSSFHGQHQSRGLTFWIWATSAAPLLKLCSAASGSERLLRDPALLVNTGAGSVPGGSYCWLEGHFPFNTTWQMLSRRLIITRSC